MDIPVINHKLLKPVKIIYKYKNENKKLQYEIFIYVGHEGLVYEEIFKKIKNLNLYETFIALTNKEIRKIEERFGDKWFLYFFNTYHINHIFDKIKTDYKLKNKLLEKYDEEWLKSVINIFSLNIMKNKASYSFNDFLKQEHRMKLGKKLTKIEKDDLQDIDLKEINANENILYKKTYGGNNNDDTIDYDDDDDEFTNINSNNDNNNEELFNINDNNDILLEDMNNINELYGDIEINTAIKKSNQEISEIFNEKTITNKKKHMTLISESKDNSFEDSKLEYVYDKVFIYTQFLFDDDTIKNIKNKICSSILNSKKFGNANYLIPSRLYLWSQYIYNNDVENIMLGHRWSKNNELLNINIEPLTLYNYENLEGNINVLMNIFKNYSKKIILTNTEDNIFNEYSNYVMNNEIFMMDIYNILGLNYSSSENKKENLINTLFKIYFPKISEEDIVNIFDYLNKTNDKEEKYIEDVFETIYNNNLLENEVTELIENIKLESNSIYTSIFKHDNIIIQSNMDVYLNIYDEQLEQENNINLNKVNLKNDEYNVITLPTLDLFGIFNDFKTNFELYPFVQYNVIGKDNMIKINAEFELECSKEKNMVEMIDKWAKTSPYGVSFKIKISATKYMNVELNEIGKLTYKIIWSESDQTSINDLFNVHSYIINLINILNENLEKHNNKVYIKTPESIDFKFSFINSIQKYEFPKNASVDYITLTNFAKLFYPYVSLIANIDKAGTYLQFKRVSKYKIKNSIEQRIISHLRYTKYNEAELIQELQKLFGFNKEKAKQEIEEVKNNKSKIISTLKKLDEIPSYKNPGTRIDMQGASSDRYKIKISGAKDIKEMNRILIFLNSLLYLYYEIYINNNKKYDKVKNKLTELTIIAKKRTLVEDDVKIITDLQKIKKNNILLNYTPEDGLSGYSRLCQNSGENNKKRPKVFLENDIDALLKDGYKYNETTNNYEKNVVTKKEGKITLQTLKLKLYDEASDKFNILYYSCDPKNNNEHTYAGFLTKTNECLPCCFKKNPFKTTNVNKLNFYKKCLNVDTNNENDIVKTVSSNDILYILQDTHKITENRIGYLPTYIGYFFNGKVKNTISTKNLYLTQTGEKGYYFKYGVVQNNYSFIHSLSAILYMSVNDIKKHIIDFLKTDKDELYYMALNQGDIRLNHKIYDFCKLLENNEIIDYEYLKDIIKIKGLFTKNGIFPIVFSKKDRRHENNIKEEFYLDIENDFVDDDLFNIRSIDKMDVVVFLKEGKYYYPIINLAKLKLKNRNNKITIFIENKEIKKNIISFFKFSIDDIKNNFANRHKTIKHLYLILKNLIKENKELAKFEIQFQVIDSQFKCCYAILKNKLFIPVKPSGILNTIPVVCLGSNTNNGCYAFNDFLTFEETKKLTDELYIKSNKIINIKTIGVFYDKNDSNKLNCLGIITSSSDMLPIKEEYIEIAYLEKHKLVYKNIPFTYEIDKKLLTYDKNNIIDIDDRIISVNQDKYLYECYQLFRFEFSYYINMEKNKDIRSKLYKIAKSGNKKELQEYIYEICNDTKNKNIFLNVTEEIPNLNNYILNNQRQICGKMNENDCNTNTHCVYKNKKCYFTLFEENFYTNIIRLSVELIDDNVKFMEIFKEKNYYVSEIVNYNIFNERKGEKLIKKNINNLNLYNSLFNNDIIKTKKNKKKIVLYEKELIDIQFNNPLKDVKTSYIQNIIPFNYSVLRAYVNGYYWLKHKLYDEVDKNLKYYSVNQNEYLYLFISLIIDWVSNNDNHVILFELENETKKILLDSINIDNNLQNEINLFIINIIKYNKEKNIGLFELFILNKIHHIPIVILFNGVVKYCINNDIIVTNDESLLISDNICINIENLINGYPQNVEIIYYK